MNITSLISGSPKMGTTASRTLLTQESVSPKNEGNFFISNKNALRRSSAGNRLGLRIGALHDIEHRGFTTLYGNRRNEELIDKAVRKYQLLTDNGKNPDVQHFPSVLSDLLAKIDELQV